MNKNNVLTFLIKSCIFCILIICFSILKVFEPYIGTEIPVRQSILMLEICSLICLAFLSSNLMKNYKCFRYIIVVCLFSVILVGAGLYKTILIRNLPVTVALYYASNYIYILLILPISYLLIFRCWELKKILLWVVLLSAISYIVRIFISRYEGVMGVVLFPSIALEDAIAGWRRNGVLRVNPPAMVNIFIPIAAYMMLEMKNKWGKLAYLGAIVLSLYFSFTVHQARSVLIYQTITVLFIYFLKHKPQKKECIMWIVLSALLLCTPQFQHFFESLSFGYRGEDATTQVRINAIKYFFNMFKETPVLGIGFLDGKDALAQGGGHIADIGILATIFITGIPGICLLLLIFIRGIWVSYKGFRYHREMNEMILVVSMTVNFWLTNINIDCFGALLAISTPFYVAILEFVNYRFDRDRGDKF